MEKNSHQTISKISSLHSNEYMLSCQMDCAKGILFKTVMVDLDLIPTGFQKYTHTHTKRTHHVRTKIAKHRHDSNIRLVHPQHSRNGSTGTVTHFAIGAPVNFALIRAFIALRHHDSTPAIDASAIE